MPTEMELTLEQTQQGVSYEVSVDPPDLKAYLKSWLVEIPDSSTHSSRTLPSNTITNLKVDLKGITTRSGVAYQGPTIPTTSSSPPKVVERKTEVTKDTVPPTNKGSAKDVQPLVVPVETQNSKPVVAPVSAPKPNPKPLIRYSSRLNDQKIREKTNNQIEKFNQIFQDLNFDISFADALILMPKFSSTLKSLISNKEKLFEWARTPLNEHCSAVLLKMDECLALADLGASINLMPLSVWKRSHNINLTPTCMTLELADRSISQPIGIVEDVYVKVGKFQFSANFVVVDFDVDPRVPLILGRSSLKIGRALIDVYEGKLTLRVGKEAITFNLDQTSRYSSNYDDNSVNRINVIDMACEEYSQYVLCFSDVIASGNPTPNYDLIVSTSSPTLTPFGDSDFLLEEVDAFLALEDDPTSPEVDHSYYDPEGNILLLGAFLNDDPSLPPPTQGNYLPEIQKELKVYEAKSDKSSIDEPPEVEIKDLPPHLKYAFLEGDDKLPIIIPKDLSVEEKAALIKVLKSHKRALTWKLSDIKGVNPKFYTHKILMEKDYKLAVQHQRRVNPKIYDVLKKEVEKLLDAGLIHPILDSPWHCVRTRQYLSMGDFGNEYIRKGQKSKPKRQYRARERKDREKSKGQRTDNQEKEEKQSQNDKTGLGMEKTVKDKAKSKPESQSSQKVNRKVNWSKSKSTPGPKSKKYKSRG
ncbi:reverse transcriptase domain-containing protein [Tanacetum coccineum]